MNRKAIVAILLLALLVALLTVIRQQSTDKPPIEERMDAFLSCLPDTLLNEQRDEVKQTLLHFQTLQEAGKVARDDYIEIIDILDSYIERGVISKQELHQFLAKVGYYSIRLTPENLDVDGTVKPPDHPLLEEGASDSASTYR